MQIKLFTISIDKIESYNEELKIWKNNNKLLLTKNIVHLADSTKNQDDSNK